MIVKNIITQNFIVQDLRQLKKFPKAVKRDGIILVLKAIKRTYYYRVFNKLANFKTDINSERYWDVRLKRNWDQSGGDVQTRQFAIGLIANVNLRELVGIKSILDFGCATGEACPILRTVFPDSKIYIHDIAKNGVDKAIRKYGKLLSVEVWPNATKVDFVYSSNVIEHVNDTKAFLEQIIRVSNRYILIQCPWEEYHANGERITPRNSQSEHVWTIDDQFISKFFDQKDIVWTKITGKVPIAWDGGEQLFMLGEKSRQVSSTKEGSLH